jgi:hypothetical protein
MPTHARTEPLVIPQSTIDWLTEPDNPAVSVLFQREFLGASEDETAELWARRNEYEPLAHILQAQDPIGYWLPPDQDYQKYHGNLWQIVFLGELWANPEDPRVRRGLDYGLIRQHETGAWGVTRATSTEAPCLTANVGRSIARLGHADDERVLAALQWLGETHEDLGYLGCKGVEESTLNGYCHMCVPKYLLFMGEVPEELWPSTTHDLRDSCLKALRDKQIYRSLPTNATQFREEVLPQPRSELAEARQRFIQEHGEIECSEKPSWLRFGYPLHYNSDALEALTALASVGEKSLPAYAPALDEVVEAADHDMRWRLRSSLNGKMIADVEEKGQPSKWVTLRALRVLRHFGRLE